MMKPRPRPRPRTPCRGICSTGIDGSVCRGCKRFAHEVIAWNGYSVAERTSVIARLDQLTTRIMKSRCRILDGDLLLARMGEYKIRFDEAADPYCWLYELMRAGAGQIRDPHAFGFEALPDYQTTPLAELFDDAERALLALSAAHYERYVAPWRLAASEPGDH